MFTWLEGTALAQWVGLSLWAYPSLLAIHITGLAVVVGIFFMRDLRLLGVVRVPFPADFTRPVRLAYAGFLLNAVSGFMLFTSQATIFAVSTSFRFKIAFILLGMILAWQIQKRLLALPADSSDVPGNLRVLAAISLACWVSAIIAGRLIAYLG